MPRTAILLCLCGVSLVATQPLEGQRGRISHRRKQAEGPHRISAGAYAGLGFTTAGQPTGSHSGVVGQIGIYGEYARHALRPGIDARLSGQSFALPLPNIFSDGSDGDGTATEKLIGPRLSYAKGIAHPYVEGLFGKGYQSNIEMPGNQNEFFANGIAKYAVGGIDFDADSHVQVRIEYAAGRISSPQSFLIQNFTVGTVFRFP